MYTIALLLVNVIKNQVVSDRNKTIADLRNMRIYRKCKR